MLRATTLAEQSQQVMRCFRLETDNYCLGLGFVDKVPTGAQLSATAAAQPLTAEADAHNGTEQDIATGALSPADFVAERSAISIDWEVRSVTEGVEQFQIQRWQPGLARPQRIYATPPDTALTPPTCQDGNLIVEAAHLGAGSKYTEALRATTV